MESIWNVTQLTSLAGLTFVLSLAYTRLERTRHKTAIVQASREMMTRLGEADGALEPYREREYYLILKALAEEHTVSDYRRHLQSSGGFLSGFFIELYFRDNLDRKISNWIVRLSLLGIVASNPPVLQLIPMIFPVGVIVGIVIVYSILLILGLIVVTVFILQGEHALPCARALIEKCGSELEAYMDSEVPKSRR